MLGIAQNDTDLKEAGRNLKSIPLGGEKKRVAQPKRVRKHQVFYRVSKHDGSRWLVIHAGLGIAEAKRYGRELSLLGISARITGSNGKRICFPAEEEKCGF